MNKSFYMSLALVVSFLLCSFYFLNKNDSSSRDIVLLFITYNGYGNNLYIDNVLTGIQPAVDITATSILNIPYDTTYSTRQSGGDTVVPLVSIANIGRTDVLDTINVVLDISGVYSDTVQVFSLGSGQTAVVSFDTFYYNIGTGYYFNAIVNYADSNLTNNRYNQYSIILPGYEREVLFEEFTSNSSPSCANNNSSLNNFINFNFSSITPIKYHTGLLGLDSFYIENPQQADERSNYYYLSGVPTTYVDGKLTASIPYGDSSNLYTPYYTRLSKGTPISMSVTDQRTGGNSNVATIDVNIISALPSGNYRLRINAIERFILADSVGTNGETQFYDVFREFYPDSNGIAISTTPGSHQYQYTYTIQPGWVDSMIYTAAFIQNDNTREVMNSAKGRSTPFRHFKQPTNISSVKSDLLNVSYDYRNHPGKKDGPIDSVQTTLNVELFEAFFPPLGWKIFNQDGYITFDKFTGANGITITGNNAVIMDFFDYNIIGQRDSMYSKTYAGLLSSDTVRFDYSYAQFNSTYIDSLIVKISSDGGLTFPVEIFRKGGLALATAPQTTLFFIPNNSNQWRSYNYPLNGIVSVDNNFGEIPVRFELKQNYPNPFNPKTIISYQLPVTNFVKLKVYDILGKEIVTLVNEKQSPGSYSVTFDGSNLSSGIYFYQLTTEGYTDTKRMVLIK